MHGIRTSSTMWRSQIAYLDARGNPVTAVDLPGHGTRMDDLFSLDGAMHTIDDAVREALATGDPVLLVGHSMGGLLSTAYAGAADAPPLAGFIAASCTAFPRGAGLAAYRLIAGALNVLPDHGAWMSERMLSATLPLETREDFGAGGYAFAAQDRALRSLSVLDLVHDLQRLDMPTWFINGQYDQLRIHERAFVDLVPHAELIVVPRTTHLLTAMRPKVFNAALGLALATIENPPA